METVNALRVELAEELAKLPDSLTSLYPDVGADFLYSVFKDCVDDVVERSKEEGASGKRTRKRDEKSNVVSKNGEEDGDNDDDGGKHLDFCIDGKKLAEAKKYKDKMLSYARDLEKNCISVYSVDYWEENKKKKMRNGGAGAGNGGLSKCAICGKVVMLEYQGLHRRHCREKEVEKSKSNASLSSSSSSSSSSESSSSESSSSSSSSESESDSDEEGTTGVKMQNQVKSRFYKVDSKSVPVSAGRPNIPASNGRKKQQQKREASTARGGGGPRKKVAKVSSKPAVGVCAPMQNVMASEMPRDMPGQAQSPMFGNVYQPASVNDAGMGRVVQQQVYGHYNNAFPQQQAQQMGAQGFANYGTAVPAMPYQNNTHQIANNMNLTPQQMQILAQYRYQQFLMQKQHGIAMGSPNLMVPQTGQYQVYGLQPNLHQPVPSSSAGPGVISGYNPMHQVPPYAPWQNLPRINVPAQNRMPANFIPQQPMDSISHPAAATTTTGYPFPATSPMGIPPMFPGSSGQHSQPGASPGGAWWEKQ